MTIFLRLLNESDKGAALAESCTQARQGHLEARLFEIKPDAFNSVQGKPFAYWVGTEVFNLFTTLPRFASEGRQCKQGLASGDDFRFARAWWEVQPSTIVSGSPRWSQDQYKNATFLSTYWCPFAKGGAFSPFYQDLTLLIRWKDDGKEIRNFTDPKTGNELSRYRGADRYFKPGFTYADRASSRFCPRILPAGSIISVKGSGIYPQDLKSGWADLGLLNSLVFNRLMDLMLGTVELAKSYQVNTVGRVPWPRIGPEARASLASLARRGYDLTRNLDTTEETSHAFHLPALLRAQAGEYDPQRIEQELSFIQSEIDEIAFSLYGFSAADWQAAFGQNEASAAGDTESGNKVEEMDEDLDASVDQGDALLSWTVGVAFGRFDWHLATGERAVPPPPEPFDPLPTQSPGMLPKGMEPFHPNFGILVDDPGHPQDLVRLMEGVLERVNMPVPTDLRRWLQREFFPFHLQRYSKSRRKAPIYWPLSTESGGYTLWLYYPSLSSQTLYTAINDYVDPRLTDVAGEADQLRAKGSARSSDDEKRLEHLATLEAELRDLHDQLQAIATRYHPNHDDGVQITAAPLWPLFRHKSWQKVLKETWAKLEKGDYSWSHLAMNYWPDRVREKCKTDKSLAITHGLEELYVEPEAKSKKGRGRKDATE